MKCWNKIQTTLKLFTDGERLNSISNYTMNQKKTLKKPKKWTHKINRFYQI